jgi:DNA-binding transcriptional regulator YiaG
MKTQTCGTCNEVAAIVRRNYQFTGMGIPVEMEGIEVIDCSHCGTVDPIIPNVDGLMLTVAMAVICNPRKLCGAEVKLLRKYVGKSATDFARLLHVDPTHLSKIENDRTEIGPRTDKLVRFMVASMSPELTARIQELVKMLPDINDSSCDKTYGLQFNPRTMSCHYAMA